MAFLETGAPTWALIAASLMLSWGAAPVLAQEPREQARVLFREGNKLYAKRRYENALQKFRQAKALYPRSRRIDLHIAYALTKLGRKAMAAEQLHWFLVKEGDRAEDKVVKKVRARLRALKAKVGSVELSCAVPGAVVEVDGAVVGKTPLPVSIYKRAGTHQIRVKAPGHHPFALSLSFAPGQHQRMVARLIPIPPARPAKPVPQYAPDPTPVYKKWWLWTIVGAVVVGGAVAIAASQAGDGETMPAAELGDLSME